MVKGKLFSSLVCCAAISLAGAEKPAGLSQLWLEKDQTRRVKLQDQMQELIDRTAKAEFDAFDHDPAAVTGNVLLQFYDLNLDKIKADIPETEVVPGTAVMDFRNSNVFMSILIPFAGIIERLVRADGLVRGIKMHLLVGILGGVAHPVAGHLMHVAAQPALVVEHFHDSFLH